jgi:hypothetical protein
MEGLKHVTFMIFKLIFVCVENMSGLQFSPLASSYSSIMQYNDSKLFCLLFAQALHNRYSHLGE